MNVDKEQPEIIILWNKEYLLTHGDVVDLLKKFGDLLIIPLRKQLDLNEYAKKLLRYSNIEIALHKDKIIGIIVIYANDFNTFTAHIPFASLDPHYQGLGIGKAMMNCAMDLARQRGMKYLWLEVRKVNVSAQRFYESLGLKPISTKDSKIQLGIEIDN
jgi:ribosomal protein S18 acetylase RimI-like enzyme